jgi:exosome complex RNA-binding protein Csl4
MAQNLMAASSGLPSVLVSQQLTAAEVTQYTCPASSSAKLAAATVVNTSAAAATVALSIVKSGGAAGASNRVATFPLAAESSVVSELAGHFLGPGDFVSAIAGTAAAITLVLSGVVFS